MKNAIFAEDLWLFMFMKFQKHISGQLALNIILAI